MDSEFGYSLVPSSCLSHTSSSAESFIRMTIRFTWCATTWHLHDPKLLKLRKPSEVPPAPKLVFIPKPSAPRLPPIPRLANPNLGCKSKISLPSEHLRSESSHSESATTLYQ